MDDAVANVVDMDIILAEVRVTLVHSMFNFALSGGDSCHLVPHLYSRVY